MQDLKKLIKSLLVFNADATNNNHLEFTSICRQTDIEVHRISENNYLIEVYPDGQHKTIECNSLTETANKVKELMTVYILATCKKITIISLT